MKCSYIKIFLRNNIKPGDVTKVLLSHLHKDHAGGISYKDKLGHYHLAFENAKYYVQKSEFEFAMNTGFPSFYDRRNFNFRKK